MAVVKLRRELIEVLERYKHLPECKEVIAEYSAVLDIKEGVNVKLSERLRNSRFCTSGDLSLLLSRKKDDFLIIYFEEGDKYLIFDESSKYRQLLDSLRESSYTEEQLRRYQIVMTEEKQKFTLNCTNDDSSTIKRLETCAARIYKAEIIVCRNAESNRTQISIDVAISNKDECEKTYYEFLSDVEVSKYLAPYICFPTPRVDPITRIKYFKYAIKPCAFKEADDPYDDAEVFKNLNTFHRPVVPTTLENNNITNTDTWIRMHPPADGDSSRDYFDRYATTCKMKSIECISIQRFSYMLRKQGYSTKYLNHVTRLYYVLPQ